MKERSWEVFLPEIAPMLWRLVNEAVEEARSRRVERDIDVAIVLGTVRSALKHAAEQLATRRDVAAILETHGAALAELLKDTPERVDPTGPVTLYMRQLAGMSRAVLARAMSRSEGAVAAWEQAPRDAGSPSLTIGGHPELSVFRTRRCSPSP
jgi:DNA-binding transcriptional regulator YiaG